MPEPLEILPDLQLMVSVRLMQELREAGLDGQAAAIVAYKMHRRFPGLFASVDCTPDSSWGKDTCAPDQPDNRFAGLDII